MTFNTEWKLSLAPKEVDMSSCWVAPKEQVSVDTVVSFDESGSPGNPRRVRSRLSRPRQPLNRNLSTGPLGRVPKRKEAVVLRVRPKMEDGKLTVSRSEVPIGGVMRRGTSSGRVGRSHRPGMSAGTVEE